MRWTMDIRCLVVIVAVFYSADTQNGRGPQRYDHTGRGWDIRLAVPGEPGNDYPTLGNIPRTSFSCAGKQPGYYADLETNCQAFRVCTLGSTYGFQSFLCPNGTLFNQAVFVCDWWMNVDCQKSQQMFSNNNEQFGNLRIGPQLMKDIKKMITHPMRNPYDKTIMKSNLIVMQDYKPPAGQMSPNPIALTNSEKPFGSAKGQLLFGQNGFSDNVFAASTPSSQYLPANGNTNQLTTQVEVFQQQRQNGQYNQQGQSGQYNVQQGQTGQFNVQRGQFTQQRQNGPYAQSQSGKYIQGQSGQYSQQSQNGRYVQKGTGQITQQVQTEQYQQPRQNGYATFNRAQSTQNVQLGNQISNAQPARYTLPTNTAVTSNIPANIVIQPTQSYNQANLKFGQRQISNTAKTQPYNSQNAINLQRGQFNRQSAQYTNNNIPSNSGKQTEFGISFTKQQSSNYNSNQERQPYTYNAPQSPQFSNEVIGQVGTDAKENLALVYSFLADSLNAAKEYGNIAQHNLAAPSPTQPQFQNINNEELAQITNQISHLTSSQYSSNNGNNFHTANLVSTTSSGPNSGQLNKGQTQSAQYNIAPAIQVTQSQYNSQYQNSNANLQSNQNQNQVYSGQLYQLPVPDVTSQIYNGPSAAKLIQPSVQQQHSEAQHLQTGGNQNNNQVHNTLNQQSSAEVEIVQSQTLPYSSSPAKLQQAPSTDQDSSQENSAKLLENFLNSENGISAQLQDKIVGTIPHPSEENKLVTYKKDQSYYLFTKIGQTAQNSNTQTNNIGTQQSAKLIQGNNNPNVVLQFIPSVSYQLDDEKEQQNILNTFQINEFGSPRDKSSQAENVQRVTNTQTSDVQVNDVNNLYAGPSSYSAPQSSVGSLDTRTVNINNRVSSRLEQLDNTNSNNNEGYSNAKPSRQFSF